MTHIPNDSKMNNGLDVFFVHSKILNEVNSSLINDLIK
jgi:hypothetical protein